MPTQVGPRMGAPEYRRATPIAHSRGIPAGPSPGAPAAVSCCEQLVAKRRVGHGRSRPLGGAAGSGGFREERTCRAAYIAAAAESPGGGTFCNPEGA